jgi:conjugative transfer region protein (TIGR03750 family)
LTHKYPAFLGCTLEEVFVVISVYLMADLFLSMAFSLAWGSFFLFLVGFFVVSLFLISWTCRGIGSFKANKQPGYLLLRLKQGLNKTLGFPVPFVTRQGRWLTRRS